MPHVIIVVADGVRPDTLAAAMDAGEVPALAALRDAQGMHTLTTVFPSVTGPAYVPFLMGEHPAHVGLPGLRWFDRSRRDTAWPHFTRSYIGSEMRKVDRDLDPDRATAFERAGGGLAMMNMIGRGLPRRNRLTDSVAFALRAGYTHFRGDVSGWLDVDRALARQMLDRVVHERPPFTFASFCGVDKTSHSVGHRAPIVRQALRIVDRFVADVQAAARDGWHDELALFVVSDHGHVDVAAHDDLADLFRERGLRVLAHPKIFGVRDPEIAVMVSGNAMAHLFVELRHRRRPFWPALSARWEETVAMLLARESVDLLLLPHDPQTVEIRARDDRGRAIARRTAGRFEYRCDSGDPLGLGGDLADVSEAEVWERSRDTDYPDALVQVLALNDCARTGDIILSATRDWDFRGRYEPIPHKSSHGALHRDHMLVPMLTTLPMHAPWRRTEEVFHRAMQYLGLHSARVV